MTRGCDDYIRVVPPSLDLIADELRRERENHVRHLDAFETKAGILLGSSGALAAIGAQHVTAARTPGLVVAVLATLAALVTLFPPQHPAWDATLLRSHVQSNEVFTKLMMVDTDVAALEVVKLALERKRRRLRIASALLALAVLLTALGTIVD